MPPPHHHHYHHLLPMEGAGVSGPGREEKEEEGYVASGASEPPVLAVSSQAMGHPLSAEHSQRGVRTRELWREEPRALALRQACQSLE